MNAKKLIAVILVILVIISGFMAFRTNPAEAKGVYRVNRCQEVLQQIATSHQVNSGDTFNNPHPGCIAVGKSSSIFVDTSKRNSQVTVPTEIEPTATPIPEITSTPEPTENVTEEPTQQATEEPTQEVTEKPTQKVDPTPTEKNTPAPHTKTCNPNSPGDNINVSGQHDCSGHNPSESSGQQNNKKNKP